MHAAIYYCHYFSVKNFFEILKGKSLHNVSTPLTSRPKSLQWLLSCLFRVYSGYQLLEDFETFYRNMQTENDVAFLKQTFEQCKETFNQDIYIMTANSDEIVDGFGIQDYELISALGSKETKSIDQVYELIMDIVRKNPLN